MADTNAVTGPSVATVPGSSFVEWSAVLAGGVMAAAIAFVLLTFGTAIGLSAASPWNDSWLSAKVVASLAVFWAMAQQIAALLVGGYIAGRMRSRWSGTDVDEVEFRDGLHGGLVWAVCVVISAFLVLSTAGAIVRTGTEAVGRVASAAATNADPLAYQVDTLLRSASPPGTGPGAAQAATPVNTEQRAEVVRILTRSVATGSLAENDRSYLAGLVAQRTGLPREEAERRVNTAFAEATRATKEAADTARRAAVLTGFVTAASLVISLGAAWWAAVKGGHHRDNSVPARFPVQRRTILHPRP